MSGEPVLIIDDNPMNLKLEKLVLEVEAYKVRIAHSASEALSLLQDFQPELILMDLQLPDVDGVELTRQIKAKPQFKDIPIVIVTSYSQKGDEDRAWAAGCDEYIHKPIDTKALPAIVGSFLRRKGTDGPSAVKSNTVS